jgi:hypothetical protein
MDSNKYSIQVERLGVVETGRRRRWTDDEKLKIVLESMQTPRAITSTARRFASIASGANTSSRCFTSDEEGEIWRATIAGGDRGPHTALGVGASPILSRVAGGPMSDWQPDFDELAVTEESTALMLCDVPATFT